MADQLQPHDLQQINVTIQVANAISHSLLFSLGRQYLDQQFDKAAYIQPFPPTSPLLGRSHFLRLEQVGDSLAGSLQQQLTALQVTLSACHNLGGDKLVFIISSDGSKKHVYLGTRSKNTDFVENLQAMLEGNWADTQLKLCFPEDLEFKTHIEKPLQDNFRYPTALTGIPSLNPGIHLGYSQTDRLLQSLRSSPFMYMVIAEPMAETEVNKVIYSLRELMGLVYSLSKVTVDDTFTKSIFEELQQTNTRSEAIATDTSKINEKSDDIAANMTTLMKLGFVALEPLLPTEYKQAVKIGELAAERVIPDLFKKWPGTASEPFTNKTSSISDTQTRGLSQTAAQALRREYINAHAQAAETQIKQYIERFEQARALGCWNVGVYFLAEDPRIAQRGGTQLKGLFSGEKSASEPLRIHNLHDYDATLWNSALDDLRNFQQPSLGLVEPNNPEHRLNHPLGSAFNGLTTPLNTEELSLLINLPNPKVSGVRVMPTQK